MVFDWHLMVCHLIYAYTYQCIVLSTYDYKLHWSTLTHSQSGRFLQTVTKLGGGQAVTWESWETIRTTTGLRKPGKLQTDGRGGAVGFSSSGHGMWSGYRWSGVLMSDRDQDSARILIRTMMGTSWSDSGDIRRSDRRQPSMVFSKLDSKVKLPTYHQHLQFIFSKTRTVNHSTVRHTTR